jgi:hypothetical protein
MVACRKIQEYKLKLTPDVMSQKCICFRGLIRGLLNGLRFLKDEAPAQRGAFSDGGQRAPATV